MKTKSARSAPVNSPGLPPLAPDAPTAAPITAVGDFFSNPPYWLQSVVTTPATELADIHAEGLRVLVGTEPGGPELVIDRSDNLGPGQETTLVFDLQTATPLNYFLRCQSFNPHGVANSGQICLSAQAPLPYQFLSFMDFTDTGLTLGLPNGFVPPVPCSGDDAHYYIRVRKASGDDLTWSVVPESAGLLPPSDLVAVTLEAIDLGYMFELVAVNSFGESPSSADGEGGFELSTPSTVEFLGGFQASSTEYQFTLPDLPFNAGWFTVSVNVSNSTPPPARVYPSDVVTLTVPALSDMIITIQAWNVGGHSEFAFAYQMEP